MPPGFISFGGPVQLWVAANAAMKFRVS